MKDTCIVFLKNNTRIYTGPKAYETYVSNRDSALFNPSLEDVKGIEPHYWKKSGDKVLPMNALEKQVRDHLIGKNGVQTKIDVTINNKLSIIDILFILITPFIYLFRKLKSLRPVPPPINNELEELKDDFKELSEDLMALERENEELIDLLKICQEYVLVPSPDNSSRAQDAFKAYNLKHR